MGRPGTEGGQHLRGELAFPEGASWHFSSKWRERKMELSLGRRRLPVHQGSCKRERSRNFSFIVGSLSLQHS